MNTRVMILSIATALLVSACGDDGSPTSSSPPPPPPPVTSVVLDTGGLLRTGFAAFIRFQTNARGGLETNVDWTHRNNTVFIWLAKGNCRPRQFFDGECDLRITSTPLNEVNKPRRLTLPNADSGQYTLIVFNR